MTTRKLSHGAGSSPVWRKALVSGFVLASYLVYAVHDHFAAPAPAVAALPPAPQPSQPSPSGASQSQDQAAPVQGGQNFVQAAPPQGGTQGGAQGGQNLVLANPAPQASSGGQYKNGTFTGANANAFYGQVQVQVVINNGKISSVTFLNYPKDRRTSARINSFAVPQLQSEAIQAQSANVDIVSGATLTSQAFMVSLQSALKNARS